VNDPPLETLAVQVVASLLGVPHETDPPLSVMLVRLSPSGAGDVIVSFWVPDR
jgi:hypothetical protein